MRLLPALLLCLTAPLIQAAPVSPDSLASLASLASIKPSCRETDRMYDRREMTCTLPASAKPRNFQFRATFTGGHDDTSASIEPVLGEQPLKCAEGSKLSLFGEDGDVSLHCNFHSSAAAGKATELKVLIKWSHAEYADFDFLAD